MNEIEHARAGDHRVWHEERGRMVWVQKGAVEVARPVAEERSSRMDGVFATWKSRLARVFGKEIIDEAFALVQRRDLIADTDTFEKPAALEAAIATWNGPMYDIWRRGEPLSRVYGDGPNPIIDISHPDFEPIRELRGVSPSWLDLIPDTAISNTTGNGKHLSWEDSAEVARLHMMLRVNAFFELLANRLHEMRGTKQTWGKTRLAAERGLPAEMRSRALHYGDVFHATNTRGEPIGVWTAWGRFTTNWGGGMGAYSCEQDACRTGWCAYETMHVDQQHTSKIPYSWSGAGPEVLRGIVAARQEGWLPYAMTTQLRFRGIFPWMDGFLIAPTDVVFLEGYHEKDGWRSLLWDDPGRPSVYFLFREILEKGPYGTEMKRYYKGHWGHQWGNNEWHPPTPPIILHEALRMGLYLVGGLPVLHGTNYLAGSASMQDGKPTRLVRMTPYWTKKSSLSGEATVDFFVGHLLGSPNESVVLPDGEPEGMAKYSFQITEIVSLAESQLLKEARATLDRLDAEAEAIRKAKEKAAAEAIRKAEEMRRQRIVDVRGVAVAMVQQAQDEAAEALEAEAARLQREATLLGIWQEESWLATIERKQALADLAQMTAVEAEAKETEKQKAAEREATLDRLREVAEKEAREQRIALLQQETLSQAAFEAERARLDKASNERKEEAVLKFRSKTGEDEF